MKSFRQLYEHPDHVYYDGNLHGIERQAYPFFVYKNKLYIGTNATTHSDLWSSQIYSDLNYYGEDLKKIVKDMKSIGRLWKDIKVISFYNHPEDKDAFYTMMKEHRRGFDLRNYKVEVKGEFVPWDEFEGADNIPYNAIHL